MQSELAQTIVGQLRAQLGGAVTASSIAEIKAEVQTAGKGGTTNLEAYQFYLQGLFFLNQFSPDTAVRAAEYLEHAVKLDPQYAFAWAALSKAGTIQIGYANTKQGFEQGTALARRAVDRALALQPDLAAAQLAKMRVQIWGDYNWKGGRESLRRASQAAPEEASIIAAAAELAYQLGQMENAVDFGREAVARDPVNTEVRGIFAFALLRLGRYAEAEAQFRRVIELNPKALWGHGGLAQLFLRQARFDEAMREADREDVEWTRYTVQSMALWSLGKQAESDAVLAKLTTGYADVSAYQIAQAYAYRGQNDLAFQWLERAYRQRDSGISFLRAELTLENLHNDARWPVFLAKVGLADSQLN